MQTFVCFSASLLYVLTSRGAGLLFGLADVLPIDTLYELAPFAGSKFTLNSVAINLTFVTLEVKYWRQIITFRAQQHACHKFIRTVRKLGQYGNLLSSLFQEEARSGDK